PECSSLLPVLEGRQGRGIPNSSHRSRERMEADIPVINGDFLPDGNVPPSDSRAALDLGVGIVGVVGEAIVVASENVVTVLVVEGGVKFELGLSRRGKTLDHVRRDELVEVELELPDDRAGGDRLASDETEAV